MKFYSNVFYIYCIWVISVLTIMYFSFVSLPHSNLFTGSFIQSLSNWDGGHYLAIAQKGYFQKSEYVFFPLYPILINLVSKITGDFLWAGILISFSSSFLAVNILYQIITMEFNKAYALKTVLALLFFPLSFHFLTVYSESLFLLLTLATFFFAKKRFLFLATIAAALASATRLSGLAVVVSLFLYVYLTGGLTRKNWFIFLAPLGFLIYSFYLYNQTGDLLYFIQAESNYWQGGLVLPGSALIHVFKNLLTGGYLANNFRDFLNFLFVIFGITFVWQAFKKLSLDYTSFALISLGLTLFSPTIVAIPRYLLTIFPIFILIGFVKNQYFWIFYQTISLMLLAIYAMLFINGYWVS